MKTKSLALVGALILALLLFTGCNQNPGRITQDPNKPAAAKNATLVIGAAASLNEAFTELGQLFETKNPGWKVEFTFASSGNLKTSIEQGAPLDVFASAAEKQMNDLKSSGHIDANSVKLMLKNELVMVAPKNSTVKSLNEVTGLGRVAIGEPISVPAGQYAKQSLTSLGYYEVAGIGVLDWEGRELKVPWVEGLRLGQQAAFGIRGENLALVKQGNEFTSKKETNLTGARIKEVVPSWIGHRLTLSFDHTDREMEMLISSSAYERHVKDKKEILVDFEMPFLCYLGEPKKIGH